MRKLLTVMLCVFAASASVWADGDKPSYLPSAFPENWFIQAGGVGNTVFNSSIGPISPGAELYLGKWITPSLGLRVGALGWQNRPNGTQTGWFSGCNAFWYGQTDLDVMWSLFNTFKYKETRFWDLVPYARLGAVWTKQKTDDPMHAEFGGGIGLHNGLRLGKRVDLYIEVSVVAAREKAYRERGDVAIFPTASAGVVLKLGPVGFRERKPTKEYIYEKQFVDREVVKTDTVTVEKTVVDSLIIQKMREEPLTLFFDLDKTVLTQREIDHLEFYAKYVLTPDSKVLLTGSADRETGNSEHNQWLSEKRNEYVRNILMNVYGLKRENIQEIANGDRKNEFRTPEQNRCVTISFIK